VVDLGHSGLVEGRVGCGGNEVAVSLGSEALFPLFARHRVGSAPPVEEFGGAGDGGDNIGDRRSFTEEKCCGAITAELLVG
jgi:hypothetical protein